MLTPRYPKEDRKSRKTIAAEAAHRGALDEIVFEQGGVKQEGARGRGKLLAGCKGPEERKGGGKQRAVGNMTQDWQEANGRAG